MKKRPRKFILQILTASIALSLLFLYESFSEPAFQLHHEGGLSTYTTENDGDLTPLYLHAIGEAKKSICCMNYAIKDRRIISALNASAKRGVSISVVYDASASAGIEDLLHKDIQRKRYEGQGLMHMKLLTIDDETAYVGTANFTQSSLTKHANTVIRISHPGMVSYIQEKTFSYPKVISKKPQTFSLPGIDLIFSFLPDDKTAAEGVKQILRSAQKTIDVAMFTFTRMDFAKELVAAHARGVAVTVTLDEGSMKGTSKKIAVYLKKNGVFVKKGISDGLYHHKLALIDGTTWIVGSANWTRSAFEKNGEYLIFMHRYKQEPSNTQSYGVRQ